MKKRKKPTALKGITSNVFKQINIGRHWGYTAQVASQLQIFVTTVILLFSAMTFYNTTFYPWMLLRGITFPAWAFFFIMFVGFAVLILLLFKFAVPSFFSAFNDQFYKHGNLMRTDIETIKKDNKEILKRLKKLEK